MSVNVSTFDWPWSVVHIISGTLVGTTLSLAFPKWPARKFWIAALGILITWELFEGALRFLNANAHDAVAPFKRAMFGYFFAYETPTNVLGDILIGSLGIVVARRILALRPNRSPVDVSPPRA